MLQSFIPAVFLFLWEGKSPSDIHWCAFPLWEIVSYMAQDSQVFKALYTLFLASFPLCICLSPTVPGVVPGCLVKETLKVGSSLKGDGYILLRMKKPAPQQNNTPIISSTLSEKQRTSQTFNSANINNPQMQVQQEQKSPMRKEQGWNKPLMIDQ